MYLDGMSCFEFLQVLAVNEKMQVCGLPFCRLRKASIDSCVTRNVSLLNTVLLYI